MKTDRRITDSFYTHKGYNIRLRAATRNGFYYRIGKASADGTKEIVLCEKGFDFIDAKLLLQKAKDRIDKNSKRLEEKYTKLTLNQ